MLKEFGPDMWTADGGNVSFFGIAYPTRMAVVRLADGGLWVWSPIHLSPKIERAIVALGPVRHLVSPNKLHHLFLGQWSARFPDAKLWGTASTVAKIEHLHFSGTLTDRAPSDWAGQIDQYHFDNSRFLDEMIFFHRASRTAIVGDYSQPFSETFLKRQWPWWARALARLVGMVEGRGYAPLEVRMTFRHRATARAKLRALVDEAPERVVVAHGELV
ncbi:MAG TPA: DUF4336 domain-containing protein, partial [Sphingomicrobium sp.]